MRFMRDHQPVFVAAHCENDGREHCNNLAALKWEWSSCQAFV